MSDVSRLSTRAIGWRLDRRDGYRLGFTSHDRCVRIAALDHYPQPGLKLTSVRQSGAYEPGGFDIEGALDSALLTEDDLLAGRWRQAAVTAFCFDWEDPEADVQVLLRARIARYAIDNGLFRAELIEQRPGARNAVPRTAPGCRALFTGPDCGLSPSRFRHETLVSAIDGTVLTLDAVPAGVMFAGGSLRWLDGPNCGLRTPIAAQDGNAITIALSPYFASELPQPVELTEGCDHDFTTCAVRFGNAVNFRGEPHLPGMDFLTRYPGG